MQNWKHFSLDVYQCDPDILRDSKTIFTLIKKIVILSKMKPIGDLVIASLPETPEYIKLGNDGVTYVQIIQTSNITLHAVYSKLCIHFDMISCKDFNEHEVLILILGTLKTNKFIQKVFYRPQQI